MYCANSRSILLRYHFFYGIREASNLIARSNRVSVIFIEKSFREYFSSSGFKSLIYYLISIKRNKMFSIKKFNVIQIRRPSSEIPITNRKSVKLTARLSANVSYQKMTDIAKEKKIANINRDSLSNLCHECRDM